jgi:hypothetical protein
VPHPHSVERVFKPHEGPEHLDCELIKRLKLFDEFSSDRRRFDMMQWDQYDSSRSSMRLDLDARQMTMFF